MIRSEQRRPVFSAGVAGYLKWGLLTALLAALAACSQPTEQPVSGGDQTTSAETQVSEVSPESAAVAPAEEPHQQEQETGETPSMSEDAPGLTVEDAVEIARREVEKLGKDTTSLQFKADDENTAWKHHVHKAPSSLETETVRKMDLESRSYWAVYFAPEKMLLGGDGFVFVDRNTGEVIGVYRGR